MSSRMRDVLAREIDELRWEPTEKRVRATMGGRAAVDSTRALLVWEPQRVVPSYAVPLDDVRGELVRAPGVAPEGDPASLGFRWSEPGLPERVVLDPRVPFGVHTADGEPLGVRVGEASREGVAFRPADPDLGGHVILDFYGFDAWYEEEEPIVGHPRDPFHRIDILRSSRHVRIERDGHLLAESVRPRLLFETLLPTRFYLPREDVRAELRPSSKRTYCAYKGEASYWSPSVGGRTLDDLAWNYESPRREAAEVAGLVAFFNERVDVVLDGERLARPHTAWS